MFKQLGMFRSQVFVNEFWRFEQLAAVFAPILVGFLLFDQRLCNLVDFPTVLHQRQFDNSRGSNVLFTILAVKLLYIKL